MSSDENGYKFFRKGDMIVYAVALLFVAAFTLLAFLYPKEQGNRFSVYYHDQKIFSASLENDADYLFYVTETGGTVVPFLNCLPDTEYNVISVREGSVCVSEANCPDGTCVAMGRKTWGEIICLPHGYLRIVVEGDGLESDV